jgi:hypothetical protein
MIVVGSIFVSLGILMFVFSKHRKWFSLLCFFLGASVIYIAAWGPLKNKNEKLQEVISINADSIKEIRIAPWNYNGYSKLSLIHHTVRLYDSTTIKKLNNALRQGKITSEILNTTPQWTCRVEIIKTNNEHISFGVERHGSTVLHVASNGENGWIYGYIWADSFGNLIDSIVSR